MFRLKLLLLQTPDAKGRSGCDSTNSDETADVVRTQLIIAERLASFVRSLMLLWMRAGCCGYIFFRPLHKSMVFTNMRG